MRVLVILRGLPGCGKSTFIRENGLEPFVLGPDTIRLMYSAPILNADGKLGINQSMYKQVWSLMMQLVEERMKQGCFTVIDATNIRNSDMRGYKKLANEYKYRVYVVDFTDIDKDEAKRRNLLREEYKQVPEFVIDKMAELLAENSTPTGVNVIKPEKIASIWYKEKDLSQYKKIVHIGDIHGCYTALMKYLGNEELDPETYYIFVGDYIDRGYENGKIMQLMLKLMAMPNVLLLEGNHEIYLKDYEKEASVGNSEFYLHTADELCEVGITHKDTYNFYRKLAQLICYTYHGKKVLVTHGGLSRMPENLTFISTGEIISGSGAYVQALEVDESFAKCALDNEYQIHGHRNAEGMPVQVNDHCFNLEGGVEIGGHLRIVELTEAGFKTIEIDNSQADSTMVYNSNVDKTQMEDMNKLLQAFENNRNIKEKNFGYISSFNFNSLAFYNKAWDDITCKARGLYIDKEHKQVVARSYDKFFNLNERPETSLQALKKNLQYPVKAYVKVNGFLGIVGYDYRADKMIITSKSDMNGLYAKIFQSVLLSELKDKVQYLKKYVKNNNCSVIFECVDPIRDPHMIEYERAHVVLLEIVENTLNFKHKSYEDAVQLAINLGVKVKENAYTLHNWDEFNSWLEQIMKPDYQYKGAYIEGFVIEDAVGFMTKLKLRYYSYWKRMRHLAQTVLTKGAIQGRWKLDDALSKNFYQWLQQKVYPLRQADGSYPFAIDIISLHKMYEKDIEYEE